MRVKQFHVTNWPAQDKLPDSDAVLQMMDCVEKWQQQSGNNPITIHCM